MGVGWADPWTGGEQAEEAIDALHGGEASTDALARRVQIHANWAMATSCNGTAAT